MKYFIHDGDTEKGPFSIEELRQETITIRTPVWHPGLDHWIIAGEVAEIRDLIFDEGNLPATARGVLASPAYLYEQGTLVPTLPGNRQRNLVLLVAAIIAGLFFGWIMLHEIGEINSITSVKATK